MCDPSRWPTFKRLQVAYFERPLTASVPGRARPHVGNHARQSDHRICCVLFGDFAKVISSVSYTVFGGEFNGELSVRLSVILDAIRIVPIYRGIPQICSRSKKGCAWNNKQRQDPLAPTPPCCFSLNLAPVYRMTKPAAWPQVVLIVSQDLVHGKPIHSPRNSVCRFAATCGVCAVETGRRGPEGPAWRVRERLPSHRTRSHHRVSPRETPRQTSISVYSTHPDGRSTPPGPLGLPRTPRAPVRPDTQSQAVSSFFAPFRVTARVAHWGMLFLHPRV